MNHELTQSSIYATHKPLVLILGMFQILYDGAKVLMRDR